MSVEFIDTNLLVYACDSGACTRHSKAVDLLERLGAEHSGAVSVQVLMEFYSIATRKLGVSSEEAEEIIRSLSSWITHCPRHSDVLSAVRLQRRHKLAWWDAMILHSAGEVGADVLWSEDFQNGQKFGPVTIRNPFR